MAHLHPTPYLVSPPIVTVSRWGGGDPRTVKVADLACSWSVEAPGLCDFLVPRGVARALDFDDWLGRWVRFEHPTAGAWAGVVTDVPRTVSDQHLHVSCTDFRELLAKKRTPLTYKVTSAPAGALARRALQDVNNETHLYLASTSADEWGDVLSVEWQGEQLLDVLDRLAQQSGQEWRVDADRNFEWRVRLGSDKTDVAIVGAHHVADGTRDRSLGTVVNDLLGLPADDPAANPERVVLHDKASVARYGRRQDSASYVGAVVSSVIEPHVRADLNRTRRPAMPVSLTLVDRDLIWSRFREGDTVSLMLHDETVSSGFGLLRFRVVARALDATRNLLTVSGDAEER